MTTYERLRAQKVCTWCRKQTQRTLAGKARCYECEERLKENHRYRKAQRRKAGLCEWCGEPSKERLCDKCRQIERRYAAERRVRLELR